MFGFDRCPSPKANKGRHHWVRWRNEKHRNTGKTHGPESYLVFHCDLCGAIKK